MAAIVLFIAIFPGNLKMALEGGGSTTYKILAWARLPLQIPLVLWARRVARDAAVPQASARVKD